MAAPPLPPGRDKRPGSAARPFSIRLTDEEKRHLVERAGGRPLGAFVRDLVLAKGSRVPRKRMRRAPTPVKDHAALARVLAALGQTRMANNLNQLARAVNIGVLPVNAETESDISEACSAIAAIRRDLMQALGVAKGTNS